MESQENKVEKIKTPLEVIQEIFEKEESSQKDLDNKWVYSNWGISKHFKNIIGESWEEIPLLNKANINNLKDGSLVRYRGMVQDMFDPEYYLGVYEQIDISTNTKRMMSGKYRDELPETDTIHVNYESPSNVTLDRLVLYCTPLPGETDWLSPVVPLNQKNDIKTIKESTTSNPKSKRKAPEEDEEAMDVDDQPSKKASTKNEQGSTISIDDNHLKELEDSKYPLGRKDDISCVVKVYDESDESFKLNQVIEFSGILSIAPQLTSFKSKDEEMENMETRVPPSSLVPRLHCVTYRKLNTLQLIASPEIIKEEQKFIGENLSVIRKQLIDYISSSLGGDSFVAEYVLMTLISKIYSRPEGMVVGKFSLNVKGCPLEPQLHSIFVNSFSQLLNSLLITTITLPLTIENLEELNFCPKKDYETNRLKTGVLQVSDGTVLVIDEGALQEGKIGAHGINSMKVINDLLIWQKVEYDFKYHPIEFHSDVPIITLSPGKSIFTCTCQVSIKPLQTYSLPSLPSPISPTFDIFRKWRIFIATVQNLSYTIDPSVGKQMQEDFVQFRKDDPNITPDTFSLSLTIARLQALSHGEEKLSYDRWKSVILMEKIRTTQRL